MHSTDKDSTGEDSTGEDLTETLRLSELGGTVTCSLSLGDRAVRQLEWADLGSLSLTSERIPDGAASTYPIDMADAVEDLANREKSCCGSWLDATTERVGDTIRLEITTKNPDGLAVILSMSGHPE